jgi:hypothetical protein
MHRLINPRGQKMTKCAARQSQIEAERSEGGVHSKTMDNDGGSIWQCRSKQVVTF